MSIEVWAADERVRLARSQAVRRRARALGEMFYEQGGAPGGAPSGFPGGPGSSGGAPVGFGGNTGGGTEGSSKCQDHLIFFSDSSISL